MSLGHCDGGDEREHADAQNDENQVSDKVSIPI